MSIDSHEIYYQRRESDKEYHVCFKVSREYIDSEVTSLTNDQMFSLSVKVIRNNDEL